MGLLNLIMQLLFGIQENILLVDYTTFKIGGPARYFFVAKNQDEIISALQWANKNELSFFVLGGGSNLLASDAGFNGLVIKIQNTEYKIQDTKIIAGAGVNFGKLIIESINAGLTGLEWAMGIPGTVGGAVYGNAGAYGHSISENVEEIKAINEGNQELGISNQDCGFVYRGSIFKENKNIITEVILRLNKGNKEESQKKIREAIEDRRKKTPPYPSAGCMFKNYVLENENDILVKNFPELASRVKGGKIGVGYLIDRCGLKGEQVGQAKVSEEHANFIINLGGATAQDILNLGELVKKEVKEKWGVALEYETRFLGFLYRELA